MIFLIEYDRPAGRLVNLKPFDDVQQLEAERLRLEIELDLNRRGIAHEVVLLQAQSEEVLRRTQRRYFESLSQLSS